MDFMEQIEQWNQDNENGRIIEAIEALPEAEQTPQLISILARAYNNLAEADDAPLFRKAIALLKSVQDDLQDDYTWNFRMAYAYYYLNEEGPALYYFERALEASPGNEDVQWYIDDCRDRLTFPQFEKPFRVRAEEGWASFLAGEAELRSMMDETLDSERLMEFCTELLSPAFANIAFQLGYNGEKYELVLSSEGNRAKLFQLVYFQRRAPAKGLERWNILVGRQPSTQFSLRMDGRDISAEDVLVWFGESVNGRVTLSCYCEKLLPLLREDEGEAYWFFAILLEQAIGELSAIDLVYHVELLEAHADGQAVGMDCLAQALEQRGLALIHDAGQLLERYTAYELEPVEREDADLRLDTFAGVTRCPPVLNDYFDNSSGLMNSFHRDGAVPGFFYYPLDGFPKTEGRGAQVLNFRDSIETSILRQAGEDAVVFTGGASGTYYGYLDFIAWDLPAVLEAAAAAFAESPIPWAAFHTFRRDVGGMTLKKGPEEE